MSSARQNFEAPISPVTRTILLGMALVLLSVFIVALLLNPDPRGYGTHQQLGLPPCTFQFLFGRPCPGCGMTTCFAHFVRGQFLQAVHANPAGAVLAVVCALLIPWSLWSVRCGRFWMVSDPIPAAAFLSISLSIVIVFLWVVRLAGFA